MKRRANKPLPRMASIKTLERLAVRGAAGRGWYAHAAAEVTAAADMLGVPPQRLADILSVVSPRVSVRKSIRLALAYIRTGSTRGILPAVRVALRHYEQTGEIRGPKTSAFARAIMSDPDAVVLDVWIAAAFGIDQRQFARPAVHEECCKRVRTVARRLGWTPAETQAAIWCGVATLARGETRRDASDKRYRTAPRFTVTENITLWDKAA